MHADADQHFFNNDLFERANKQKTKQTTPPKIKKSISKLNHITMGRTSKHKDSVKMESSSKDVASKSSIPEVKKPIKQTPAELVEEHLPPMALICCVLVFSGALFVLGLRDALATGRPIAGPMDVAFLVCILFSIVLRWVKYTPSSCVTLFFDFASNSLSSTPFPFSPPWLTPHETFSLS